MSGAPTWPTPVPAPPSRASFPVESPGSENTGSQLRPPVNEPRHRPSVGLVIVVALTVLALSAGVLLVFTRSSSPTAGQGPTSLTSSSGGQTATTPPTDTSTDTSTDNETGQTDQTGQTSETSPGGDTTTPTALVTSPALVGVVQLEQDLVDDPTARQAATALSAFYTAISERRFRDAFALYTSSARKRLGNYSTWSSGYATTTYEGIVLNAIDKRAQGVVTAHVTFTSRQAPRDAPDGSSECLVWDIAYRLVPVSGTSPFHIDRAQSDAPSGTKPYRQCP